VDLARRHHSGLIGLSPALNAAAISAWISSGLLADMRAASSQAPRRDHPTIRGTSASECHNRWMSVASPERLRSGLVRLVHRGGVRDFSLAAARSLARAVQFDGVCVLTMDPATVLP
jgi:hypothetical protein